MKKSNINGGEIAATEKKKKIISSVRVLFSKLFEISGTSAKLYTKDSLC